MAHRETKRVTGAEERALSPTAPAITQRVRVQRRILVVTNEKADEPHQRVIAVAIDENLVGRGQTIAEALKNLENTICDSVEFEWRSLFPPYAPDPDPELARLFQEKSLTHTAEGYLVIHRLTAEICLPIKAGPSTSSAVVTATYEECHLL